VGRTNRSSRAAAAAYAELTVPVGAALTRSSASYRPGRWMHAAVARAASLMRKVGVALHILPLHRQTIMIPNPLPSAPSLKGPRSEPLVRPAIPRAPHPPTYVAKLRKAWRVVVPVRGRLSPRIIAREFPTQSAALTWLSSEEGQNAVACERARYQHSAERRNEPETREDLSCC